MVQKILVGFLVHSGYRIFAYGFLVYRAGRAVEILPFIYAACEKK